MARSRDIEFARMALIFDFVKRDQVYEAIRELALLQELEINKNIDHIKKWSTSFSCATSAFCMIQALLL